MRLFVSYSHQDRQITRNLETLLTSAGHEVWIDNNLITGKSWQQQLKDEIHKADAIVLALTPRWQASPYCQWEYMTAVEAGRKVIPVMLEKVDLPDYIGTHRDSDKMCFFNIEMVE